MKFIFLLKNVTNLIKFQKHYLMYNVILRNDELITAHKGHQIFATEKTHIIIPKFHSFSTSLPQFYSGRVDS